MYWTAPETCIAVVCACLPTLRLIFIGMSPESVTEQHPLRALAALARRQQSQLAAPVRGAEVDGLRQCARQLRAVRVRQHARFVQMSDEGGAATPPRPCADCRQGRDRDRGSGGGVGWEKDGPGVLVGSAQGLGKVDGILV